MPSFQDWQFPHDKLPDSWPAVPPTEAAQAAECVITRFPWALDRAHIVPTAQAPWFDDNGMSRYGTSVCPSIDDDGNLLWLRRDLHTPTFDAFWFALVPKPVVATTTTTAATATATATTIAYTVHVLVDSQPLFPTFYHDIQLPHLRGVAREFLFARFAQAVFIRVKPFVIVRKRRLIARFVVDGMKEEVIREELSGDALFKAYGGGRTRSASPTKRKRGGEEPSSSVVGQEEEWPPGIVNSDLDEDEDEDEEEGRRGRKRRRTWEGDLGEGIACRDGGGLAEVEVGKWSKPLSSERLSGLPDLSTSVASVDE